ncbi:MAG: hypothetical protein ACLUOI_27225 [Eisenbergiella sp.]
MTFRKPSRGSGGSVDRLDEVGVIVNIYKPEMPMNTGNIGWLCVATTEVQSIEPLGFRLSDREIKRFLTHLDVTVYDYRFLDRNRSKDLWYYDKRTM